MPGHPFHALAIALVLSPAFGAGAPPCEAPRGPLLDRAAAPIRSPADLADYLAHGQVALDPLAALSAPGRARFLASLRFGAEGVTAFQSQDVQAELTAAQACRLLALFGLQSTVVAMPPLPVKSDEDAAVEAWRRAQSPPDLRYR
jgi:hypothetical protein